MIHCVKQVKWYSTKGPWKINFFPEKSLKKGFNFLYEPCDSEDDVFFLGAIGNKEEKMKHWSEEIEVNDVTVKFKLDTGADVTVIGDSI